MEEILNNFTSLTSSQIDQYKALADLYREWNSKINVISRKDMSEFYVQHVIHSLAIGKIIRFEKDTAILDVGTGGGFPAIPLAILFPECRFTAVDSIGKKIKVVRAIADAIGLKNLEAFHQRAEETEGKFDFVVSRAVTRTKRFVPWVANKFRKESFNALPNGFLLLKGGDLTEELDEVGKQYQEYSISDFFKADFFKTKKVVYLPS